MWHVACMPCVLTAKRACLQVNELPLFARAEYDFEPSAPDELLLAVCLCMFVCVHVCMYVYVHMAVWMLLCGCCANVY
jgi:hypothetical protein